MEYWKLLGDRALVSRHFQAAFYMIRAGVWSGLAPPFLKAQINESEPGRGSRLHPSRLIRSLAGEVEWSRCLNSTS